MRSGASVSRWITGGIEPSSSENILGSTEISPSCRFQYVHIDWFGTTSPLGVLTSSDIGRSSRLQKCLAHGPGATTTCSTSIVPWSVSTAVTSRPLGETKPVTSTPEVMVTPSDSHLPTQAGDGVEVERESALLLVQADGHVLRAPVGEELLHVRVDLGLAEDQLGVVADALVALEDRRQISVLPLRAERDVADRVVA